MGRNVGENRREAAARSTEVCRLGLVESCRDEMHRAVIHVVADVQFERVGRLMIRTPSRCARVILAVPYGTHYAIYGR